MLLEFFLLTLTSVIAVLLYYHVVIKDHFVVYWDKSKTGDLGRELGRAEQLFHWLMKQCNLQTTCVHVVESKTSIPSNAVLKTLHSLALRYPVLRMCIQELSHTRSRFKEIKNVEIICTSCDLLASEQSSWETVFREEAARQLDWQKGPLWRVCRLKECYNKENKTYSNCFAFTFHHAICDGASRLMLFQQFLDSLELIIEGRPPKREGTDLLPPLENLLRDYFPRSTSWKFKAVWKDLSMRLFAMGYFSRPKLGFITRFFNKYPPAISADPLAKKETRALFQEFSVEFTGRMIAASKNHNCSFTSLLITALSMAMADLLRDDKDDSDILIPSNGAINLRKHERWDEKFPAMKGGLGVYIDLISHTLSVPNYSNKDITEVFWALSQETTSNLRSVLHKKIHLQNLMDSLCCASNAAYFKVFDQGVKSNICDRYGDNYFFFSSNGVFNTASGEGSIKLTKIFAGVNEHRIGPLFTSNFTTVNGHCCLSFVYHSNITTKYVATMFHKKMLDILHTVIQ